MLTLFISIGIGLATLTALAFSTHPSRSVYITTYDLLLPFEPYVRSNNTGKITLGLDHNISDTQAVIDEIKGSLSPPEGANITVLSLEYNSTENQCFADTSIISEPIRQILKHISSKFFFISIGIVTILYTITFVLALQRQNPRIRALKKSLNVLSRFDTNSSSKRTTKQTDSPVAAPSNTTTGPPRTRTTPPKQNTTTRSDGKSKLNTKNSRSSQQYEMSRIIVNEDSDDQHPSVTLLQKTAKDPEQDPPVSASEGTSDDLPPDAEKCNGAKQVSFHIDQRRNILKKQRNMQFSLSSVSSDVDLAGNNDIHYKLPCPCSQTRQLLIKFHFAGPSSYLHRWLCCCCYWKNRAMANRHRPSNQSTMEDEASNILPSPVPPAHSSSIHSETLKRQLHQHRLKQIRMASTFLIITVSFVLLYLPSILNAEQIIRSPMTVYYLYLCTHALNPLIYCFMNPSLRAYVVSMFKCRSRREQSSFKTKARLQSFVERWRFTRRTLVLHFFSFAYRIRFFVVPIVVLVLIVVIECEWKTPFVL